MSKPCIYHLMDWMQWNNRELDSFDNLEDLRAAYERIRPNTDPELDPCYFEEIAWDERGEATEYERYGIYE